MNYSKRRRGEQIFSLHKARLSANEFCPGTHTFLQRPRALHILPAVNEHNLARLENGGKVRVHRKNNKFCPYRAFTLQQAATHSTMI